MYWTAKMLLNSRVLMRACNRGAVGHGCSGVRRRTVTKPQIQKQQQQYWEVQHRSFHHPTLIQAYNRRMRIVNSSQSMYIRQFSTTKNDEPKPDEGKKDEGEWGPHPFWEENFISTEEFQEKYMRQAADPNKHHIPRPSEPIPENLVTVVTHKQTVDADAGAGRNYVSTPKFFAIVDLRGAQYKVTNGDLLVVDRMDVDEYPVGKQLEFDRVLLVGSADRTLVGRPNVIGATVTAMVEQHTKDKKLLVFKKKRRKNHKKSQGFRRHLTLLRIKDISPGSLMSE